MRVQIIKIGIAISVAVAGACKPVKESNAKPGRPSAASGVTVAFIGDQRMGRRARSVLRLIKAERTDMVLHQGDFDYRDNPIGWDAMITEILGADFPYFASVGNHDVKRWAGSNGYQEMLQARLRRIRGAKCVGELGVRSACSYRGLFFILSGVGTIPKKPNAREHITFIREQLAATESVWRICSWHKNQTKMQVGSKKNDVGWLPYEECRKGGAIVATGHEHSYSRTHLMDSFEKQTIVSTSRTMQLDKGRSFAFVSGLGGAGIRNEDRGGPWWASVYTSDQRANYGALFCTFFLNGNQNKARCYFKDVDGAIPDQFELVSNIGRPKLNKPNDSTSDFKGVKPPIDQDR